MIGNLSHGGHKCIWFETYDPYFVACLCDSKTWVSRAEVEQVTRSAPKEAKPCPKCTLVAAEIAVDAERMKGEK